MNTSYVIDAARTPRGRGKAGKGALSVVHPQELERTGKQTAPVTMCVGGGQGIATVLERV